MDTRIAGNKMLRVVPQPLGRDNPYRGRWEFQELRNGKWLRLTTQPTKEQAREDMNAWKDL